MAIFAVTSLLLFFRVQAAPVTETTTQGAILEFTSFEKCFDDLGCFSNGPPFYHPLYRPVSLLPGNDINTKFLLFTPNNSSSEQELEPRIESLNKSAYDPNLETKFIIHGFVSSLKEGDYKYRIKDALLRYGKYNVILVDWTDNNGIPYPQAVANARVVGAQIARLIHFLMNSTGIQSESVHLIGHSLGAQLSGWAGERIPNLGRITGLDPAGPYFHFAENIVRLDPSDALFVDIIHTDGGTNFIEGLGTLEPIGHLDFYPNGGDSQPGCGSSIKGNSTAGETDTDNVEKLDGSSTCDHSRAPELYISSIADDEASCRFDSIACEDWAKFQAGECREDSRNLRTQMGYHSQRIPGVIPGKRFYLETTSSPPYCLPSETV